jgi:hypothetical protein
LFQACEGEGVSKEQLYKTAKSILDEIGYDRQLPVIRWLGILLLKVMKRTCSSLYVNETSVNRVSCYLVVLKLRGSHSLQYGQCGCNPGSLLSPVFPHHIRDNSSVHLLTCLVNVMSGLGITPAFN